MLEKRDFVIDPKVVALNWEDYRKPEWHHVMERIFTFTGGPLRLDDLVGMMFTVMKIDEIQIVETQVEPSIHPAPDAEAHTREELSATWKEIVELPREQCVALLLNSAGGELDALPAAGIATLQEIAQVLAITFEEFDLLWRELRLSPAETTQAQGLVTIEERFALLWCYAPIEDRVIGAMLGKTRQEVINRRVAARQRLDRRLKNTFGSRRC
jgi:hypothetical protein